MSRERSTTNRKSRRGRRKEAGEQLEKSNREQRRQIKVNGINSSQIKEQQLIAMRELT